MRGHDFLTNDHSLRVKFLALQSPSDGVVIGDYNPVDSFANAGLDQLLWGGQAVGREDGVDMEIGEKVLVCCRNKGAQEGGILLVANFSTGCFVILIE